MPLLNLRITAFFIVLCTVGCGAGSFQGGLYREGDVAYRVRAPGGEWRAVDVSGQNDLAWHHVVHEAFIQVNASCDPTLDIPLGALTNHLLMGFTEREILSQDLRSFDGREALHTVVRAKLDGVRRQLALTVLKKDGCVYDFALVAAPGLAFTEARGAYTTLLDSFHTVEER